MGGPPSFTSSSSSSGGGSGETILRPAALSISSSAGGISRKRRRSRKKRTCLERLQTLCCCLHSLVPRQYRQLLFGGAAAAAEGRQQQWEQGEEEAEEEEEYDFDEEEREEERGMYEMVPPSPQAGEDDDVCLLMGPAGVKLEKSGGAGAAAAAAVAPSREATTVAAAARGRETRKGVMSTTLRKDGGIVRGKKVEETKDEAGEGGEVRAVVENVPHECVICLEEFTRENPEMHTRKDLRGREGGRERVREGRRVCKGFEKCFSPHFSLSLLPIIFLSFPRHETHTHNPVCSCGENRARFHYPCLLLYLERGSRGPQQQRRGEGGRERGGRQYQPLCPTCRGPLFYEEMA